MNAIPSVGATRPQYQVIKRMRDNDSNNSKKPSTRAGAENDRIELTMFYPLTQKNSEAVQISMPLLIIARHQTSK